MAGSRSCARPNLLPRGAAHRPGGPWASLDADCDRRPVAGVRAAHPYRSPFGAFAVALGAATALIAIQGDGWRFVPGAIAAGVLAADLCTRFASRERAPVAAAAASAGLVVAAGLVAIASGGLGWTATPWLGVAVAAGVAGWVIAWIASTAGALGAPSVPATSTPVDDST